MQNGTEKLRSNLVKKEQQRPTYQVSTGAIMDYFQKRFDMIVANLRKSNEKYADLEQIKVKVAGTRMSDSFYPIFLIMPTDVLEKHTLMEDESIPSAFYDHADDEDEAAHLIPVFENFLKMYAFTKEDIQLFRNAKWLRDMNLNARMMNKIVHFSTARIMSPGFGREKKDDDSNRNNFVLILLDPLRILHDMVVDEENPRVKFTVDVNDVKKFKNGVYEYHFKKRFGKKDKKGVDAQQFVKDLEAILRS